jgi:hypothetical protein
MKYMLLVIVLLSTVRIFSQSSAFNAGIHAGINSSNMFWSDKVEDETNPFAIEFPNTKFRKSFILGVNVKYNVNSLFYIPLSADVVSRKFSIETDGVVRVYGDNGQQLNIMTDFLDYKQMQLLLATGLGVNVINKLSIEAKPYVQLSLSDQMIKIGDIIDWQKDDNFQYATDYGINGTIRLHFNKLYAQVGYHHGLKNIQEYEAFDAIGAPLGKFRLRNVMWQFVIGYQIF